MTNPVARRDDAAAQPGLWIAVAVLAAYSGVWLIPEWWPGFARTALFSLYVLSVPIEGYVRRSLQMHEDGSAGRLGEFHCQGRADESISAGKRFDRHTVESPEALVYAVDRDIAGASRSPLDGDRPSGDDDRRARNVVSEFFAKKTGGEDRVTRVAQPLQHELAKAAAHRIADEKSSAENGDCRRHTQHDRCIRAPVVHEAAKNQRSWLHQDSRVRCLPES
jgi:hypothetical protein